MNAVSEPGQPGGAERIRPAAERPSAARLHRRQQKPAAPGPHPHGSHASGETGGPALSVFRVFRSGCKTNNVCLLRAVNPGAKMISSRPFWRPTPGSLTAPLPVRVLPKLVWSSDSYGFVFSTCSLCIGIHGFSRSTPSSLQGEYRAGGHVHTPSRAAPPMELNRKAAPLTYLLTYFTIHRDVSRQVRSGTKAMPSSVRCLDWSPAGCAPDGGCVIAVCSSDYRVRHVTPWLQSARWHSDEPDVTQYRRPIEDPHHTRDAASVISRPPPLATNLLTAATSPLSAASCRVVAITAAPVRH